MAITNARMQMRRGLEKDFDPDKMTPGEWAVSTDTKYVRICFSPGVCVRMATYEAFEADMEQIRGILAECQTVEEAVQRIYEDIKDVAVDVERIEAAAASALESEENALNSANSATQSANTATQKASDAAESANIASTKAEQATEGANTATQKASEALNSAENAKLSEDKSVENAKLSESYAVGGTGTREGEDTDNAKYYNQQASDNADRAEAAAERASAVADVGVATAEKVGFVKPDGTTITVDADGTIHSVGGGTAGTTDYEDLENKPSVNGIELSGNKTASDLGITAESVGADAAGSASTALSDAKSYTDTKIADLVGGAPSTLDTLKEISDALTESGEAIEAINQAIGNKIDKDGDSKDNTVTFTQASTRENIASTEKHSTLFGKIAKWFSDLNTVAFSGSYNDLSNKPTIPTVNNATLTIQKNGSNVQTFTANASSNKTANIIVPTKTSELENDSGFMGSATALDTYEEIMANTKRGELAGAKGVKEGFSEINNSLANGNISFSVESDGAYATYKVGADTVTKKLGSLSNKKVIEAYDYGLFNLSSIDGYQNFVLWDNLFVVPGKVQFYNTKWVNDIQQTYSYNSNTGILTINTGHGNLRFWQVTVYY